MILCNVKVSYVENIGGHASCQGLTDVTPEVNVLQHVTHMPPLNTN